LVLGKHTGQHSVRERLEEDGFRPTTEEVREITRRVKDRGAAKERITVETLREFARDVDVTREQVSAD
jgi:2-isopropylmalate synthase